MGCSLSKHSTQFGWLWQFITCDPESLNVHVQSSTVAQPWFSLWIFSLGTFIHVTVSHWHLERSQVQIPHQTPGFYFQSLLNITWVSTSTSNSTCLLNSSSSMPTFLPCWMTPQHHLRLIFLISNIQWIDNSCWLHYLYISHSCSFLSIQPQRFNLTQALLITLLDNFNSLLMALHTLVFSYALTPLSPLNSLLPNRTLFSSGTQSPQLASKKCDHAVYHLTWDFYESEMWC